MADEEKVNISCLCKANDIDVAIPRSSLPLSVYLCHCNSCRHVTGTLCLPGTALPVKVELEKLSLTSHRRPKGIRDYFCATCGCYMFVKGEDPERGLGVATGVLSRSDILDFKGHIFIPDTKDGGLSDWLSHVGGRELERWEAYPFEGGKPLPFGWRAPESEEGRSDSDEELRARCACGGVQFAVTRPTPESVQLNAPFADLIVPANSGRSTENPSGEPWWLSQDKRRYTAGNCACVSCRLAMGTDVVQWTFVPSTNIKRPDGKPFAVPWGTMKTYSSSPGVTRSFCSVCGGKIFFQTERRPGLIDVAVGVLDAPTGARAETWLDWSKRRISFSEEALNPTLVEALRQGLASSKLDE